MRAVVAQGGIIPPFLFSLYINDMPSPSQHVERAIYADDTAIIATSRKPTLLVSYLESYLNDLHQWLSEWRIAINVSKNAATIYARADRRFIQPRRVTLIGEPIKWVDTTRYLGVILHARLAWSPHIDQVMKGTAQWMGMLCPFLSRKSDLFFRNGVLLCKQLVHPLWTMHAPRGGPPPAPMSGVTGVTIQVSSPRYWFPLARKEQADTRVSGRSPLFRPHQSPDREL